ncbi:ATPase MORC2-like [Physella acuta]|uniref:ATPase MORC2-like n=2 Tax=Physella acuta TaxID=109671 RepID=UPI0027DDFBC3|nr:ATPase MORC2-like [Physella acuta]XP_059169297.1 ATPase MORC2-like [Physella acuta]
MDYTNLNRAQLSFDYLHTNSTTHEFLFGALAELLDNARDASATKMNIFTIKNESLRGGHILCFLDDGEGMDPIETASIVTFGKSNKKSDDLHQIGMYGNGLKSGSMRIGNDLMLFTKKSDTRSCLFLSRTFHEEENIDEVIVPIPSFEASSRKPKILDARLKEKHELEMEIILKYSPFKTLDEFFTQFDRLEGQSGTLVMVYNLKLLDSGDTELDFLTDATDIILANPSSHDFDSDEGLMPEKKSFRAYAAILYMDPRMRIYLQNKKVRTKRLACTLYKSKIYKYSSNRFKTRAENEAKRAIDEALSAENKAREAESKAKNLENKTGSSTNKEHRAALRKAQNFAAECRGNAQIKRQMAERKTKSLKEPKTLNLIFGLNLENRSHDGVFVYNCSRLIKMYEKVGPQNEGGVFCSGVVGIVDVPYLVLEPTHNKQDFADAKEYRHLMRAMGEHMIQYWKDVGIAQQGITKFWESFGYVSSEWKATPSDDIKFVRKRAMQLSVTLQCDMCLKWRMIPFNSNNIGKEFPDHWVCTMNPDQQHNKCSSAEQKLNIPEGVLKKEFKSQEQKKKDLEEEILRKTEMLEKLQKMKVVQSSKDIEVALKKEDKKEPQIEGRASLSRKAKARSPSPPPKSPSPEPPPKSRTTGSQSSVASKKNRRSPSPPARRAQKPSPKPSPQVTVKQAMKQKKRSPSPPPPPKRAAKSKPEPKVTPRRRVQRMESSEEEEEEEEVDENEDNEEDEEPITRKGRSQNNVESETKEIKRPRAKEQVIEYPEIPVKKQRISHLNTEAKKPVEVNNDSSSETSARSTRSRGKGSNLKAESSADENEAQTTDAVDVKDVSIEVDVGTRVEAHINNKWYPGSVIEVNAEDTRWKVKFDHHPKDKYDKWYDKDGSDIKLLDKKKDSSIVPSSPSSQDGAEAPTSSTTTPAVTSQITEDIANGYRTCLRYFLPPQWIMDKDAITAMSFQELSDFPLDDFFDHYERGLRRLVSNFQTEATLRKQESEDAKTKLVAVRKLIAKLLKSTNEEEGNQDFDIDPEESGDQVDELLAACVRQATSQTS